MVEKWGQLSRDKLCWIWDKAGIRIAKLVTKERKKQANHKSSDGRFEYAEATFSHVQYFFFAWDCHEFPTFLSVYRVLLD